MARRPLSESEFRDMLEEEGWHTTFVPTTPGDVDILAFKPVYRQKIGNLQVRHETPYFEMVAWEVKERKGDYLYLRDKYDKMMAFQERTGVPVKLAVKWKSQLVGEKPIWWRGEPERKMTRADCRV